MHKRTAITTVLAAATLLAGCNSYRTHAPPPTMAATGATGPVIGRPSLSMPIALPGHQTCLIPFALEDRKGWFEDRDPFTRGGYAADNSLSPRAASVASWAGTARWHNAIVRDMATSEEWPILDRRGVISRWEMFIRPVEERQPVVAEYLVFIATIEDSNGDGALDDRDATVAVVTGGDGRGPRVVTPSRAQVWSSSFDVRLGLLYFYVVSDTDGDGAYTPNDAPAPYALDPRQSGPARAIVSDRTRSHVEGLLK